ELARLGVVTGAEVEAPELVVDDAESVEHAHVVGFVRAGLFEHVQRARIVLARDRLRRLVVIAVVRGDLRVRRDYGFHLHGMGRLAEVRQMHESEAVLDRRTAAGGCYRDGGRESERLVTGHGGPHCDWLSAGPTIRTTSIRAGSSMAVMITGKKQTTT